MDRLLTKLRLRRKDEVRALPKGLTPDDNDCDNDYVLNTNRSVTHECKRLSKSYPLLSDSLKPYERTQVWGSPSMVSSGTDLTDKKFNKKKMFLSAKLKQTTVPSNGVKNRFFSRLRFGFNKNKNQMVCQSEAERDLHLVWYTSNSAVDYSPEPELQFRHSLTEYDRQKQLATSIAAELESKSKTKSLFLRNTDRLSILTQTEGKQKF